jgi:carboxypeptidase D
VNGSAGAIPDVNFDIGESYAGLLPISPAANESSELYFWFFPSANPDAGDEITIWLNGGESPIVPSSNSSKANL